MQELNEIFDSEDGTYEAINLRPEAKIPQIFLLKGAGINDVVIRIGSLVDGTKIRNLQPTTKKCVVVIMNINKRGRLVEFKGNLGDSPAKFIAKLFDIVVQTVSINKIEEILFRFPMKAIASRKTTLIPLMKKLIVARARNKYSVLDNTLQYAKKYGYIIAHKKNIDVKTLLNHEIDANRFTKVETKVGDAYIDNDTGKQISVEDVVAIELTKDLEQMTTSSIIEKSKISKTAVLGAMYSAEVFNAKRNPDEQEHYDSLQEKPPLYKANGTKPFIDADIVKNNLSDRVNTLMKGDNSDFYLLRAYLERKFSNSIFGVKKDLIKPSIEKFSEDVGEIINRMDYKNIQNSIIELVNYFTNSVFYRNSDKDEIRDDIGEFLKGILLGPIRSEIIDMYTNDELADQIEETYTEDEITAIKNYTDDAYMKINQYLIGIEPKINNGFKNTIKHLDSAFEKGMTLEKGTVLYRGQKIPYDQFKFIVENKLIYFKNYVSTSLYPLIYSSIGNHSLSVTQDSEEIVDLDNDSVHPEGERIDVALVISGADKVNVVIPGSFSAYEDECEVILPRGIALKINKIMGETLDAEEHSYENTCMFYTEVLSPDQLSESFEAIDGDLLISEGKVEIKKFDFESIYNKISLNEKEEIDVNPIASSILLSMIDIDKLPEKFK